MILHPYPASNAFICAWCIRNFLFRGSSVLPPKPSSCLKPLQDRSFELDVPSALQAYHNVKGDKTTSTDLELEQTIVSQLLFSLVHSRWARYLLRIGIVDFSFTKSSFLEYRLTDLWFPLPKQTLRQLLKDPKAEKEFGKLQEVEFDSIDEDWPASTTGPCHFAFEDGEEMMTSDKILGEGGYGIVEQVTIPTKPQPLVCVRKRLGRPKQLNAQKKLFEAFARELHVMRQVNHHHCVQLVGSYTDQDSVAILSSPVADMDLARLLDLHELDLAQSDLLREGIGCLCNALRYLHHNSIRHEDLKPQNVLVRGSSILLTDFGFSLDFSDDAISTTTGRPSAWTMRYAAPEVLNFEARNRATDIYSLGCILIEMISRLFNYRLSEVKNFWKENGNTNISFALNEEATSAWHQLLYSRSKHTQRYIDLLDLIQGMMHVKRGSRPSARQVVDRLTALGEIDKPPYLRRKEFIGSCCRARLGDEHKLQICEATSRWRLFLSLVQSSAPENQYFILANIKPRVIATKTMFPIPENYYSTFDDHFKPYRDVLEGCGCLLQDVLGPAWLGFPREPNSRAFHSYIEYKSMINFIMDGKFKFAQRKMYTRRQCSVRFPSGYWGWRIVEISLISLDMRDNFPSYIFMISCGLEEEDGDFLPFVSHNYVDGDDRNTLHDPPSTKSLRLELGDVAGLL